MKYVDINQFKSKHVTIYTIADYKRNYSRYLQ